ncbi:MAG: xylanase [Dyadobacter sp. 50-39]|uniref:glycoside hydrolase family 30 protein n=1 Tax=Dyadobacter sp. 50-39 TaxID=1895756 RepID=UPI00096454EF|nr:glycoside hydrolase family 30 protein [Dyadobacter sp. 50-39]OJV14802.1 MAG: xylanase [Dyadobacter sp. 50-39]
MQIPQNLGTLFLGLVMVTSMNCHGSEPATDNVGPDKDQTVTIRIDPSKTYQTIRNFGGSDAWACQFAGSWPLASKNGIADLLFSTDTLADGRQKGIGLSLWRFNAGGGTAEQGDASGIRDEWRRAESFFGSDGGYDWNKQAGQMWFLNAAKERGLNEFLLFPNTPPVQFTTNGKGFATNGQPNLASQQFDKFAGYLADVIDGVRKKTGITFKYVSPVNEPQWDWSDGGQEGTPFFNNQIAAITRSLSAALLKKNLPTQISVAEAGQFEYLYSEHNRPGRASQISAFFDKSSSDYIGNLPNVLPAISGHSYFTTSPYKAAVEKRKLLASAVERVPGLEFWQSEYCILGDNDGEIKGEGQDLGITPALYIARVIHNDLVNAQATAWHWWLSVSPYDYKDGLIYIDKNKTDGSYRSSKMLWALGNYSRFVRPGARRIEATSSLGTDGLLVSSYLNTNNELVTVLVNNDNEGREVQLSFGSGQKAGAARAYETSAARDLAPISGSNGKFSIKGRSIVTVVNKM